MKSAGVVLNIIIVLAAILGIAAIHLWATPCQGVLELANGNAVPMRCAYACKMATLIMAVIAVTGFVNVFAKKKTISLVLLVLAAALVSVVFEGVMGIGVCKAQMACWTMRTWIYIVVGIVGACALVSLFVGTGKKQVK